MAARPGRTAPDGSPHPDRGSPTFERDVRAMFAHIARGYERFDHVASLGSDLVWRPRALWDLERFRAGRGPPRRVLDVGCGPGDLTRLVGRRYGGTGTVGIDVTRAMLRRASEIARRRGGSAAQLDWAGATALALPFRSGSFDLVVSAFVVRNLPSLAEALAELRRVLAPGGTLLILEITEPTSPAVRRLFHAYFDTVVPWLGALAGAAGPYRYLPESLRSLPSRRELEGLLSAAGFDRVASAPQSLGIVTSYLADVERRPGPPAGDRTRGLAGSTVKGGGESSGTEPT